MAVKRPITQGTDGLEYIGGSDTIPVGNVPDITVSKLTDFAEAVEDKIGAKVVGGTGISVAYNDTTGETTVTNDDPDQTVALTEGTGISISGTYPNFTIAATGSATETYTAGEAIGARDLIYVNSSGQIMKADANDVTKQATGFCQSAISNGASGQVTFSAGAKITGFTGLTANATYFLSNSVTGGIALFSALTFTTNDIMQVVGVAEGTTAIRFLPSTPTTVTA
jgi:hypothetical protein